MQLGRFYIEDMDCPSEEQLIRSALASDEYRIDRLEFDLPQRTLRVWHDGDVDELLETLGRLRLGARLEANDEISSRSPDVVRRPNEARVLGIVLIINAVMFVVELVAGWIGSSTGLLSDSLDMLADAIVYGIALGVVGRAAASQRLAARLSGWFQLALACGVLVEVLRRAIFGSQPEAPVMMSIALLALAANVTCMLVLSPHRRGAVHMQASYIFSANDVIANLGVIVAGALVGWTGSAVPDLVVGTLIGLLVLRGASRILALSKRSP